MKKKFKDKIRSLSLKSHFILMSFILFSLISCDKKNLLMENGKMAGQDINIDLSTVIEPTQSDIISKVSTIKPEQMETIISYQADGFFTYDTRQISSISARFAGRIEKLYVKYNFQKVTVGQKLMDIYSPEISTAQQNLIYLLYNDAENKELINDSKKQLALLGLNDNQIQNILISKKPSNSVSVYSPLAGHLHDISKEMEDPENIPKDRKFTNPEFALKEGMYVTKGQNLFTIYDASKIWAILNIYPNDINKVKLGQNVEIRDESDDEIIYGKVDFIEPIYQENSKTVRLRVYLNNDHHKLKINSLLKAKISAGKEKGLWIPKTAVYDLGNNKIVWLLKNNKNFIAHKIQTGIESGKFVKIIEGLNTYDLIALNAQYLIDSESFIKVAHEN